MLDQAEVGFRRQADDRWVEISDRVLARALTTTRRSHPIRAQASSGPVQISEQVLISCLREAIDGTVAGSALAHVTLQVEGEDDLVGVTIQLIAEYGAELLPIADEVRRLASEVPRDDPRTGATAGDHQHPARPLRRCRGRRSPRLTWMTAWR